MRIKTKQEDGKVIAIASNVKPGHSFYDTAVTFKDAMRALGVSCDGMVRELISGLLPLLAQLDRKKLAGAEIKPILALEVTYADGTKEIVGAVKGDMES